MLYINFGNDTWILLRLRDSGSRVEQPRRYYSNNIAYWKCGDKDHLQWNILHTNSLGALTIIFIICFHSFISRTWFQGIITNQERKNNRFKFSRKIFIFPSFVTFSIKKNFYHPIILFFVILVKAPSSILGPSNRNFTLSWTEMKSL